MCEPQRVRCGPALAARWIEFANANGVPVHAYEKELYIDDGNDKAFRVPSYFDKGGRWVVFISDVSDISYKTKLGLMSFLSGAHCSSTVIFDFHALYKCPAGFFARWMYGAAAARVETRRVWNPAAPACVDGSVSVARQTVSFSGGLFFDEASQSFGEYIGLTENKGLFDTRRSRPLFDAECQRVKSLGGARVKFPNGLLDWESAGSAP